MMQKMITTVLSDSEGNDVLRFRFPDDTALDVCLTGESGNNQLKEVFEKVLKLQLKDDVEVDFEPTEGYTNAMYVQVCKAYTGTLANELAPVRAEIVKEGLGAKADLLRETV